MSSAWPWMQRGAAQSTVVSLTDRAGAIHLANPAFESHKWCTAVKEAIWAESALSKITA